MGIPERRARERQRRRQQIITAARRIFADQGFKNTTMTEIAREAELSTGTLYLYFKNKNELNAALALQTVGYLKIRLSEILVRQKQLSLKRKLMALKETLYELYQFEPIGLKCFFTLTPNDTKDEITLHCCVQAQHLNSWLISQIAELLSDDIKRCRVPQQSAEDLADLILSLFCGIVTRKQARNTSAEAYNGCHVKAALDTAFDFLLRELSN